MSKFDEVCQAFMTAKQAYFDEKEACCVLLTRIAEGMRKYLETPTYHLYFLPRGREGSAVKVRPSKEVAWREVDGWHFNLGMSVVDAADKPDYVTGPEFVVGEVVARRDGEGFEVRLAGRPERFKLPAEPSVEDQAPFYEFFFKQMLETYVRPGVMFFEGGPEIHRVIGR
jgi:hypothetical protein